MLSIEAAEKFICETARPFEKAAYEVLYHHKSAERALEELKNFKMKMADLVMRLNRTIGIRIQIRSRPMMRLSGSIK